MCITTKRRWFETMLRPTMKHFVQLLDWVPDVAMRQEASRAGRVECGYVGLWPRFGYCIRRPGYIVSDGWLSFLFNLYDHFVT